MTKHTPGPWKVIEGQKHEWRNEYQQFVEPPEYELLVVSDAVEHPEPIASFWNTAWGDEWEANARLIAAAPTLYGACKEVLAWLNDNGWLSADYPRAALDIAIKKVEDNS